VRDGIGVLDSTPSAPNARATSDLPLPMPPVSPTMSTSRAAQAER
jgi:hypothetical protein